MVHLDGKSKFAKVLSAGNRDLLRVIAEKAPASLDELRVVDRVEEVELVADVTDDGGMTRRLERASGEGRGEGGI